MKKATSAFLVLGFFITSVPLFAQQSTSKYVLRGVIRDSNSVIIPGLQLEVRGDYVITADALSHDKFRAFVKISHIGLNPGYLEFIIDSGALSCSKADGKEFPAIISSVEPAWPAAAKAVRASGEVVVVVKTNQEGSVSSAKAISGHPLLRAVSAQAAQKFRFEANENTLQQEVRLTFVFLWDTTKKPGLVRYECPYRIIAPMPLLEIDQIAHATLVNRETPDHFPSNASSYAL
jgi:TonB family protein